MPNNVLGSNYGTKVMKTIAAGFESAVVSCKTVDTQTIQGQHNSSTGDVIYIKRPASYKAIETDRGDLTGISKNIIGVGQIPATRQQVISVPVEWDQVEEALELNQLDETLAPIGEEVCTRLESNLNRFMLNNSALSYGTPGTPVNEWSDISGAQALMEAIGVPKTGKHYYQMDPFAKVALAGVQTGLSANGKVNTAWENAVVTDQLAGMTALSSNALNSYLTGTSTDRVGALSADPDVTWATHKDTMKQTLAVTGFTAGATIKAGETIIISGRYHTNPRNRQVIIGGDGNRLGWRATVVEDVTLDGSGDGSIVVTNAAIFDNTSNNQFDNIDSALVSGDVVTILGNANTDYKPNLFYHRAAFVMGTVKLPKLYATDVNYKSKDGIEMRMVRYSDGDAGVQKLRVDIMPVFGVTNPLFAGKGFGA